MTEGKVLAIALRDRSPRRRRVSDNRVDSYRRLHEACLAMAKQSTEPEVQARWFAMADAWLQRSMGLD
jgi:hypothetical protein